MSKISVRRTKLNIRNNRVALYVLIAGLFILLCTAESVVAQSKPRIISFSGYEWEVKTSKSSESGTMGPGNNYFSDSRQNVWVDKNGWLHLKITKIKNKWYCAEVKMIEPLGYRKTIFHVTGRVDQFHQNVVAGLFTYLDGTDHAEEIDIEFSGWGDAEKKDIAQYALQPAEIQGNLKSFDPGLTGEASTHLFNWKPGRVDFASYHGHYESVPDSALIINSWSYTGKDVPADQDGKIHINLWLFRRETIDPADRPEAEIVIRRFLAL